jgi:hypothetical protein
LLKSSHTLLRHRQQIPMHANNDELLFVRLLAHFIEPDSVLSRINSNGCLNCYEYVLSEMMSCQRKVSSFAHRFSNCKSRLFVSTLKQVKSEICVLSCFAPLSVLSSGFSFVSLLPLFLHHSTQMISSPGFSYHRSHDANFEIRIHRTGYLERLEHRPCRKRRL